MSCIPESCEYVKELEEKIDYIKLERDAQYSSYDYEIDCLQMQIISYESHDYPLQIKQLKKRINDLEHKMLRDQDKRMIEVNLRNLELEKELDQQKFNNKHNLSIDQKIADKIEELEEERDMWKNSAEGHCEHLNRILQENVALLRKYEPEKLDY